MFKFISILLGVVGVGGGIVSIVTDLLPIPIEMGAALVLGGIALFIAAAMGPKRFAPIAATAVAAAALAFAVISNLEASGVVVPDLYKMIILAVCAFAVYIASSFLVFALLFVLAFLIIMLISQN